MKTTLLSLVFALALSLAAADADAARRFGGGSNLGKQRATPMQKDTPKQEPSAAPAPAKPAQAAPASTAATPAANPSFMSRWGGLLAGLGIGVLLASLFGAQMGPIVGMLLLALLLGGIAYLIYRLFAAKRAPAPAGKPMAFAGIGSGVAGNRDNATLSPTLSQGRGSAVGSEGAIQIPGFEVEPFVRVAKTSFIRLQAANDAKDLDDIRDYTTPEMYAEIAMQIAERGDAPQKSEVVSVEAQVVEAVVEDGFEIASVRFWGLMREAPDANPESFDEVWHVRKKAGDRKATWLIAGIQQA